MVGCISGNGSTLKPLVIVPRKTMEDELRIYGYGQKEVEVVHQKNGFMTMKIFEHWGEAIFLSEVRRRRERSGYKGKALLILDGMSAHSTERFIGKCVTENIHPYFLVAHTSDQVQMLDLLTFGLMKNFISRSTFQMGISPQTNQLVKMLGAWHQATPPHLVIAAFNAAGMIQYFKQGMMFLKVDLSAAKKLRIYERSPIESPTKRIVLPNFEE